MRYYRQYITSNPNILFGKPAIKDTRIAVEHILDELAGGTTIEQLLEEYPPLSREAIYAAIAFAADTLLEIANKQKALLITSDKDYERLVLDERRPTAGVIFLRIATRIPIEHRAQIVVNLLRKYKDKLEGTFTSVTEAAIDIRRPLL